jgi:hypothetical protein
MTVPHYVLTDGWNLVLKLTGENKEIADRQNSIEQLHR